MQTFSTPGISGRAIVAAFSTYIFFSGTGLAADPATDGQTAALASVGTEVETVTVTARHRSENAQNVPISLSAVTGDALTANGISSVIDLNQLIPSLQVLSYNARNTNLIVRGLGSNIAVVNDGIEPGVGVYVDGVFYARPAETVFDLPDISSIEELRGPQGTLYGKNTVAGAINITTEAPSDTFEAKGELSGGDYGYFKASGTVSGPIDSGDGLSARLTAYDTDRNGFVKNITTDRWTHDYHDRGVRAQILYAPTPNFHLRIIADYGNQRQVCCINLFTQQVTTLDEGVVLPRTFLERAAQAGYTPLPFKPFDRVTDANSPYHAFMEDGGVSAQADWNLGGFTLTSISAYRYLNWNPANDVDGTALSVLTGARQANQAKQFTQELRLQSPSDDTFEYNLGLYYYSEEDDGFGDTTYGVDAPLWVLGAANEVTNAALVNWSVKSLSIPRTSSYAAYGQATWHILPNLDLTGGLRFTYERKTGAYSQYQDGGADLNLLPPDEQAAAQGIRNAFGPNNAYSVHVNNDLLGGLATLVYKFSPDLNAYATYSHGSKSAGLNLVNLPVTQGAPVVVQPETIDNYEVGFKSTLFDHHLIFNMDAFWDEDTNYQTTILEGFPTPVTVAANIPGVRTRGFEADASAVPVEGLEVHAAAAYTDGVYVSYKNAPCPLEACVSQVNGIWGFNPLATADLSGAALPAVSKWVVSLGGEYDAPLGSWWSTSLTGYVGGDFSWRSSYFSAANDSIYSRVPGYSVTNLRVGVRTEDERWDLSVWARNAFDTDYYITRGPTSFNSGAISVLLGDPRTVGASLRFHY